MIEAGSLHPDQGLAGSERSDFLEFNLNDLWTARAKSASDLAGKWEHGR
jgi:hypothetical protein